MTPAPTPQPAHDHGAAGFCTDHAQPPWARFPQIVTRGHRRPDDAARAALDRVRAEAWDEGALEGLRTPRGFGWTLVNNPYRAALATAPSETETGR